MIKIEKLKRRLESLNKRLEPIAKKHFGNEMNYTYWGGHELGYLKGKITELENIIDDCSGDVTSNPDEVIENIIDEFDPYEVDKFTLP